MYYDYKAQAMANISHTIAQANGFPRSLTEPIARTVRTVTNSFLCSFDLATPGTGSVSDSTASD